MEEENYQYNLWFRFPFSTWHKSLLLQSLDKKNKFNGTQEYVTRHDKITKCGHDSSKDDYSHWLHP